MNIRKIYEVEALYRENMSINGYEFGDGDLGICVLGALRGDEVNQLYVCSQLIRSLKEIESRDPSKIKRKIMIIPSANHYSLNISERFWAADNTDINRMFPGYNQGETVQRIAAGIFDGIKDYPYGIQFTTNYISGDYIPHIRIMNTFLDEMNEAREFGMPYVIRREPRPYDTTTLNYNWQVWDTKAFSLYTGASDRIDNEKSLMAFNAVLRFMNAIGVLECAVPEGVESKIINESKMHTVKTKKAGLFNLRVKTGQEVKKGDVLATVHDTIEGEMVDELVADSDGIVFFNHNKPIIYAKTIAFKILKNS